MHSDLEFQINWSRTNAVKAQRKAVERVSIKEKNNFIRDKKTQYEN